MARSPNVREKAACQGPRITWPSAANPVFHPIPAWLRQIVVLGTGLLLAAGPLLDEVRRAQRSGQVCPAGRLMQARGQASGGELGLDHSQVCCGIASGLGHVAAVPHRSESARYSDR